MGINSNALTVNGAIAANRSFQARSPDSGAGPGGEDFGAKADPGANGAAGAKAQSTAGDSASAAGQGSSKGTGAAASAGSTASAQKAGPSAQTRNAQGSRGPARSQSAAAAGSQPPATAQNADDDSSSNFGSVMATALGRSSTSSTDSTASTKTTASTDDGTGTNAAAAQPATTPTDAVAWIAQLMMAPGAAQAAGATSNTAGNPATDTAAGARTGGPTNVPAALGTSTDDGDEDATTAPATAQSAAAAAQSAAADKLNFDTDPVPVNGTQVAAQPTAQTTDAQAAATAAASTPDAASVNALADVQKMISGAVGTAADSGNGTSPATPATRRTTTDSADATQAAAAAQVSALNRADAGLGTTTLTIQAPVGSAAFADEVTSKVTGLAQSGITQAQLQLNPSDLGPVQVHITMQAGQASVWFGATHADTRAALEQSLPRLREMFAGAGLPLSDSGVFREAPQQQQAQSQSLATSGISRAAAAEKTAGASVTQVATVRLSLLDTYA